MSICELERSTVGQFQKGMSRVVGNGGKVSFWYVKWAGENSFFGSFKRLFSVSKQKECKVMDMGRSEGNAWR